ncbi:hypothetical protein [Desulfurococcus mucosus]|uniref:Uncharacterized protein n=1 Tax=Desulfurococcus mucosus (strain ATCC 35584 / DSM 2162 / JCM 9187 / O7/1) TaxID=765177 RepID=E8R754_DESM0|nr:hypothetical protein [Desulfurococcus mucosus]ADV65519.1 hypothetical protein Desmu_1223 [Desulfurococcus mucosus DSM 2162]
MLEFDGKLSSIASTEHLLRPLEDAVALGYEYLRACGVCGERKVCIYIHLKSLGDGFLAELTGVSVEVSPDTVVDEYVVKLLGYASTVRSRRGSVEFYAGPGTAVGVYYMTCRDKLVAVDVEPVEYEEVLLLGGD